jgi:hypothetical protein
MKKRGSLLLLIAVLFGLSILLTDTANSGPESTESCAIVPSTLVSWWPGNGDANDLVDGNHGTAELGTTYVTGKVGQAFQFDGTSGHVAIPDNGQGESLDGFTQLGIDAWIHPDSIGWPDPESGGHISAIVSKHDTTKPNGVSFTLFQYNGRLRFSVAQALNPDSVVGVISDDDIPIGTWSHIAAVWKGGTDLALYLNGQEMAVTQFSEGATPTSTAENDVPVNIGRVESFSGTFVGPAAFFDGMIDEVDIFSSALSASTIQSIYDAGSLGKCDPNDIGMVYLPLVAKPFKPLYLDFYAHWDGVGYLRLDVYETVGTHITRYLDEIDGNVGRVFNLHWYDPDPYGWGSSDWYEYHSMSSGEYLSSSGSSDPAWKWGYSWIVPYGVQFHNGQVVTIDAQEFTVSGPHSGYTTFGQPVDYWQLVNNKRFLFWDGGGEWKQYVLPGDAKLHYDAGRTRLLIKSDVRRFYYQNGSKTSYNIQYIENLTEADSFPQDASNRPAFADDATINETENNLLDGRFNAARHLVGDSGPFSTEGSSGMELVPDGLERSGLGPLSRQKK